MGRAVPLALAVMLLLVFAPGPAPAASFDCAKAATAVEKMVCGDPALSRLDEVLADAYRRALSASAEPETLKARQREWLRAGRDVCTDAACLTQAYRKRIGQLHGLGGFTAANGMSESELARFLQAEPNLELPTEQRLPFIPIRSAAESTARTIVFLARGPQGAMLRGTVDVSEPQPHVLHVQDYQKCHCESPTGASAVRLVAAEPDFVVMHYIPRTGTCVAVEQTEIFRIDNRGEFHEVWAGTSYLAGAQTPGVYEAEVAEISFPGACDGPDRAILRSARRVRCGGDNCFCRDGTLLDEYVELFQWDPATRQFRPAR